MYFKDFSRQLLRFSSGLFRTNEMAAESDVRKMPTVVMTGLPRSIAKKRPIAKERSIFVKIFYQNQAKKTFCAHDSQPSFCPSERTWAPRTGSQFLLGLQVSKGEQRTIDQHISSVHRHGSYNFRQTNLKHFSSLFQRQITVSMTKIYEINQHSLTLL